MKKKDQRRVDEGLEAAVDDANVTPELSCQSHVALQYIYVYTERERESARSCISGAAFAAIYKYIMILLYTNT